ncbi:MAG TPA: sugar phosphate isomerase/epimerase, partial [Bryobacteraceae bacterium]|nr:sugar phosphate isomerase/epimerase [Bryobacteraceae bacterium]
HLNEMDGRYPGSGSYPFAPLLQALRKHRYAGWLSVEVFDFRPDGHTVARKAFEHIRQIERTL